MVPGAIADGSEGGLGFADPPVVANLLKVFEGGGIPARGAVELLLNKGNTAQEQERLAGVRTRTRHPVAKMAQALIALIEQVYRSAVLALPVRQKARDGQGLTNQQWITQLTCQRQSPRC